MKHILGTAAEQSVPGPDGRAEPVTSDVSLYYAASPVDVSLTQEAAGRAPMARRTGQLIYVQALRFFAATAVVIFHELGTGSQYVQQKNAGPFSLFRFGDHGVDLFFVISGFIIYYSTHREPSSPKDFFLRRAQRLIPLYWSVTIFIFALSFVFPAVFKDTSWLNASLFFRSLFFVTHLNGSMPVVYVGWSLEYEVFFYLVVTLLLLAPKSVWDNIIIIFSSFIVLHCLLPDLLPGAIYTFYTNPLILEFVFGIGVAVLLFEKTISLPAMLFLFAATATLGYTDPYDRAILAGLPSAALVYLAALASRVRKHPGILERGLAYLGDASYSLYLVQVFVISASSKAIGKTYPLSLTMLIVITTPVVIMAGTAVYVLAERPMLRLCRKLGQGRR